MSAVVQVPAVLHGPHGVVDTRFPCHGTFRGCGVRLRAHEYNGAKRRCPICEARYEVSLADDFEHALFERLFP